MADLTRRTLLHRALLTAALGGGALLGVTRPVRHRRATPPPPPPLGLTAALTRQRQLLASYDRTLTLRPAHPELAGLRADVVAHGMALRQVLQRYPGWRLSTGSATQAAAPGRTGSSGSTGPPGSTATRSGTRPVASGVAADPIAALAAASTAAATATSAACLAWPATEANAAEVVPLLGSIAACLASHAQVLG